MVSSDRQTTATEYKRFNLTVLQSTFNISKYEPNTDMKYLLLAILTHSVEKLKNYVYQRTDKSTETAILKRKQLSEYYYLVMDQISSL